MAPIKERGNLLISALFMAGFLFFLSVALVFTNRGDIQFTIYADHKMRASLARDGTHDYVLAYMRQNADWETHIAGLNPVFASGASGKVRWSAVPSSAASARPAPPGSGAAPARVANTLPAVLLEITGQSGPFQARRHLLLEEFRLADSLLVGPIKPHLFAIQGNKISVLGPSFAWEGVPQLDGSMLESTFSAGGKDLRILVKEKGAEPPVIQDFQKTSGPNGIVLPGQFSPSPLTIPKGHGAFALKLENDQWSWLDLPDPGEQLGSVAQPAIIPDSAGLGSNNPTPTNTQTPAIGGYPGQVVTVDWSVITRSWDDLTLDWDVIAKSPSELTVDYSYFNGPRINWYSLTGEIAQASSDTYLCHGWHYFYSGFHYKNTPTSEGKVHSFGKDPTLFQEPCLLSYNSTTGKWTTIFDWLKVTDIWLEPDVISGRQPSQNSMVIDGDGRCYVQEKPEADAGLGATSKAWYEVTRDGLRAEPRIPHVDRPHYFQNEWLTSVARPANQYSLTLKGLSKDDISEFFPTRLLGFSEQNLYLQPAQPGSQEPALELLWDCDENRITSFNRDLFNIVRLYAVQRLPNNATPALSPVQAVAHFDGKGWQILPWGLRAALPKESSYRLEFGGKGTDNPCNGPITLGGYSTTRPMLRRYVPVARWTD